MKKEIKAKIKKYMPLIIATLITALMIVGCWFVGHALGAYEERNTVSASAESVSAASVDSTIYPTSNLIKLSDIYPSGTYGGLTWTVQEDGSVLLNGTSTRVHTFPVFRKYSVPSFMTVGQTYTFSSNEFSTGRLGIVHSRTASGSTVGSGAVAHNVTFTLAENTTYIDFYYYVYANQTFDNVVLKPMLNVGSVAYPWQPNYEYFYNQGEAEGLEGSKYGFWQDCTVSTRVTLNSGDKYNDMTTPTFVSNGISLDYLYSYYDSLYGASNITDIKITGIWFDEYVHGSSFTVSAGGADSAFLTEFSVVTTTTPAYIAARFVYVESLRSYGLELASSGNYDFTITGIVMWDLGGLENVLGLTLIDNNGTYRNGYNEGYDVGYSEGVADSYQNGYSVGLTEGKNQGYAQGYAAGEQSASTDGLGNLIYSIIDAPFRVIREGLNFEILGINFAGLCQWLITGALFVFVFKKVKGG